MASVQSFRTSLAAGSTTPMDVFNVFELVFGRPPASLNDVESFRSLSPFEVWLDLIGSEAFEREVLGLEGTPLKRLDHVLHPLSNTELAAWASGSLPLLSGTVESLAKARTWRRRLAFVFADELLREISGQSIRAFTDATEDRILNSAMAVAGSNEARAVRQAGSPGRRPQDRTPDAADHARSWLYPTLTPERYLSVEPDYGAGRFQAWRAVDSDPIFHLHFPNDVPHTGGLRLQVEMIAPAGATPTLYIDTGQGFTEAGRMPLPEPIGGLVDVPLILPDRFVRLRFDPMDVAARFWLGCVRVRAVESAEISELNIAADGRKQPGTSRFKAAQIIETERLCETIILETIPSQDVAAARSIGRPGWSSWRSLGSDPIFHVVRPAAGFPTGWVLIDLDMDGPEGGAPSFYVDGGRGYTEEDRIFLPPPKGGKTSVLTRLPDIVQAMRFDPLDSPGDFSLGEIAVQLLDRADVFRRVSTMLFDREGYGSGKLATLMDDVRAGRWDKAEDIMKAVVVTTKPSGNYGAWLERHENFSPSDIVDMTANIEVMESKPCFSIVMPTYNSDERWLAKAIESVRNQVYPYWELCIADDASTLATVGPQLKAAAARDDRIKLSFRKENGHIARATNTALGLATGDFIVFMDHDDEISPDALYRFAALLKVSPDIDFIYSDEDKISEQGRRNDPFFKPDWSPEYLESCMYTAHLAAYRKNIVDKIGGLRPDYNGAQDYDFTLRFTEHARQIAHVPRVLYHWRTIPGSTAQSMDNKDYVIDAAVRALRGRVERTGRPGTVTANSFKGCFDVRRAVQGQPLVSIVIPSAGRDAVIADRTVDLLVNCVNTVVKKSTYASFEIIVVDNGDLRRQTLDALKHVPIRYVTFKESVFNIAKKMNMGAGVAKGEFILFLNDDIEVIAPDWLEAMISVAQNPGVGIVGAKLRYESGLLQHVGVTFCQGLPDHIRRLFPAEDPGYFYSTVSQKNYMAVTGACMLISREIFANVGGFDERLAVNYNDIDLCLAVYARGSRIVYCPYAELYHFESLSRDRLVAADEAEVFLDKWRHLTEIDPFYSPYFGSRPPNFELSIL